MSKAHWYGLSTLPGIGSATLRSLIDRFETVDAIFEAAPDDLLAFQRVTEQVVERLKALSLPKIESRLAQWASEGIEVLTWDDDAFPDRLRGIRSPPPLLYVRGDVPVLNSSAVAIVGTREPTQEKHSLAQHFARELAQRGLTIVSGLALGIDTAAHRGALEAANGKTIAVLGSGLNAIHPSSNAELAARIAQNGALVTEYHPDTRVRGRQLMARDRIISGLSLAVIVVEANERSGSLDTAAKARKQNRPVFALPGSPGTDLLLKDGQAKELTAPIDFDALYQRILNVPPDEPVFKQASLF